MSTNQIQILITEYSVAAFVFKIEEYVKQGYRVSQDVLGYPVQCGVAYYCIVTKDVEEVEQKEVQQSTKRQTKATKADVQ